MSRFIKLVAAVALVSVPAVASAGHNRTYYTGHQGMQIAHVPVRVVDRNAGDRPYALTGSEQRDHSPNGWQQLGATRVVLPIYR